MIAFLISFCPIKGVHLTNLSFLVYFLDVQDLHRNPRKRFGLKFNLIAGIYNFEIKN
jgi:hypothetical protein